MSASNNDASDNIKVLMDIFMLLFIGFQLYITIFHLPKLSTKGFLCSNESFIFFNQIKSIKGEDKAIMLSKKLIVEYDKKSKQSFKVSNFDYGNIENHLKTYGAFSIEKESD